MTAENLCKVRLKLRRWEPARDALSFAYQLSCVRNGEKHAESKRLSEVMQWLEKYLTTAAVP